MEGMSVGVLLIFKDKDGVYHMVVATSQANATNPAVYMFDRVSDTTKPCGFKWSNRRTIVNYNGCACAAIHPQNGDLYFTHFQKGHLYRVKKIFFKNLLTEPVLQLFHLGQGRTICLPSKIKNGNLI